MRKDQWDQTCERISALWPGRKRIPEATVEAWYGELGKRADFEVMGLALTRLAAESERAPGLAALSAAVREAGGARKPRDDEEENPEDRERWDRLGKDWILINRCRHDEGVRNVLIGLMATDADPGDMRLALLDEIRVREVVPRDPEPVRAGEFSSIGESLGQVA